MPALAILQPSCAGSTRVHRKTPACAKRMDCRVKPGNDEGKSISTSVGIGAVIAPLASGSSLTALIKFKRKLSGLLEGFSLHCRISQGERKAAPLREGTMMEHRRAPRQKNIQSRAHRICRKTRGHQLSRSQPLVHRRLPGGRKPHRHSRPLQPRFRERRSASRVRGAMADEQPLGRGIPLLIALQLPFPPARFTSTYARTHQSLRRMGCALHC